MQFLIKANTPFPMTQKSHSQVFTPEKCNKQTNKQTTTKTPYIYMKIYAQLFREFLFKTVPNWKKKQISFDE